MSKRPTLTQRMLSEQLKENTGRHFLDSGGAYGRHWQRNQGRDFLKEPYQVVRFRRWRPDETWELDYIKNLFHYLDERVEYDKDMNKLFQLFLEVFDEPESYDTWNHFEEVEMFLEFLKTWRWEFGKWGDAVTGEKAAKFLKLKLDNTPTAMNHLDTLYHLWREVKRKATNRKLKDLLQSIEADGVEVEFTEYTYNTENVLSQDLQYSAISAGGSLYFAIQIHGGCDARGGFTAAKWYVPNGMIGDDEYTIALDYNRMSVACLGGHIWDADGGYPPRFESQDWPDKKQDLNEYELLTDEEIEENETELAQDYNRRRAEYKRQAQLAGEVRLGQLIAEGFPAPVEPVWRPGVIRADEDHIGYCPECGQRLE